jgi:hypothetical protein
MYRRRERRRRRILRENKRGHYPGVRSEEKRDEDSRT